MNEDVQSPRFWYFVMRRGFHGPPWRRRVPDQIIFMELDGLEKGLMWDMVYDTRFFAIVGQTSMLMSMN